MRVTQQTMTHQTLADLQTRLRQLADSQARLASGRRIAAASEDPSGMNRAIGLLAREASTRQAERNADDGLMWTALADSKLQTLLDRLHRVRELAVRAGTVTNTSEREAFSIELTTIRDEAVAIANARIGDRALFGGFQPGDAVALDAGAWTYQGDDGAVIRRVATGESVQVNVTGDQVFGFADGENLFESLDVLSDRILANDSPGVQTSIDEIDQAMERILSGLAQLGVTTNRLDAAKTRGEGELLSIQQGLSDVQSVDIAEAIMRLQTEQVAYEATLGAMARSIQPSLLHFLR